MPHADASRFGVIVTKEQAYTQVLEQATVLCDESRHWVPNLANASSLLWHALKALPAPSNAVNWAGFYVRTPARPELILGPFHGQVACQTIAVGRGVCGAAAAEKVTQLVPDVEKFPGHIACDGQTRSEIVVPIIHDDTVVAVIDIDCEELAGFDDIDRQWLEKLAALLSKACDWDA